MAMPATQIRRGNVIVFNGEPCRVVEFHHHTPGNLRAFVQTKLRNLKSGAMFEHRFRAADTVEKAFLETHELQYLYTDGLHYHFMNTETFEQVALDEEALGDGAQWLTESMVIQAEFYEGRPIGIELPNSLELEVVETEPAAKGDTKTSVTKPAKLSNGVTVTVPPFINQGDLIRVDPREGKYIERAK
ncbi:MAG TPA: elongation factor P [Longimicrobiales bacterium]